MGRVIVIDGPEKSGKSTLIAALKESLERDYLQVTVRHWGQVKPDDRIYAAPLEADFGLSDNNVVIWDRSWASEHVYGKLLGRQRRGATNPWLLEWLHGRAVHGNGLKVMVLPLDMTQNARRRDDTDLPVIPAQEYDAFLSYASLFGWDIYWNSYHENFISETVQLITEKFSMIPRGVLNPRYWTNANYLPKTPRVIIGEARNKTDFRTMGGAWLPFTSAKMCQFVQKYFGNDAFNFAWTNSDDIENGRVPHSKLDSTTGIYTFGTRAHELMAHLHYDVKAAFAHPSYFSRWNTDRGRYALQIFEEKYKEAFKL